MINGHGDDAYLYGRIASDFSSNVCPVASYKALWAHLTATPGLLSHYPEPEAWSLEEQIARRHGIRAASVIVTNGATEAIYLLAQTFRMERHIAVPTFQEYEDACTMYPVFDSEKQMLWICNPNNPTGGVFDRREVAALTRRYALVIIDQSYEHYTDQYVMSPKTALRYGNVVQIHSMTKTYAVPGLRLGYIVAPVRLAQAIRRHLRPWAVSSVAVAAGSYLLQHDELMVKPDLAEAQRLRRALSQIKGVSVDATQTNFMLCRIEHHSAAALKDYLARRHAMLIRDASNFPTLTKHHFRVAAQSPAENDALVAAIQDFIHANPPHR